MNLTQKTHNYSKCFLGVGDEPAHLRPVYKSNYQFSIYTGWGGTNTDNTYQKPSAGLSYLDLFLIILYVSAGAHSSIIRKFSQLI